MGKPQLFAIQLEKQDAVYFAGDWINGQVIVQLADHMKMRGIHLAFKGEAYVHWTEQHTTGTGENRRTETRHYSSREPYFNQSVVLFGKAQGRMSGDNPVLPPGQYIYPFQFKLPHNLPSLKKAQGRMSGDNPVLPPGQYIYPFQFKLPHNLPSSFEGGVGHIRYQLKASIDMPWQFDYVTKRPFTVVALVDLNNIPNARIPQDGGDEKMICCCCCASGPISAYLKLNRSGYVPGEYIVMDGEVDNRSTRKLKNVQFKLEMRTTFHASGKSKEQWKTISEIRRGGIRAEDKDCFTGLSLHIPPLPPSYLGGCRIIDITYVLTLQASPSGPALTLKVPLEVIIGTIPLRNVALSFVQNPYQPILYDQNAWMNAPPPMPSAPAGGALPSCPPPAYEECFWGRAAITDEDDNEHTSGTKEWAPAYPYYSWGNNPSAPPLPTEPAFQPPPGGQAYPPPGGAAYPPPGGSVHMPAGTAYAPPGGTVQNMPAGTAYAPPGGSVQNMPTGAAYAPPAGAATYPEQPPAYAPQGNYAVPPAGFAAPPAGFAALPPGSQMPPYGMQPQPDRPPKV